MNYNDAKTPNELYQYMKENIRYGFVNRDNEICIRAELGDELYEKQIFENYLLQTPEQLIKSKCGICYDQVELERKWFSENGYNVYTYYTTHHNHVILIYQDNEYYYLFERALKKQNGIYKFDNLDNVFKYYLESQSKLSTTDIDSITLFPYEQVNFGCNFYEYISNIKQNSEGQVIQKVKKR